MASITFQSLFNQCHDIDHVKQLHAHIHKLDLVHQPTQYYSTKLLNFYTTLSNDRNSGLTTASILFSRIENPNVFAFNIMIKAYSSTAGRRMMALVLYNQMLIDQVPCNSYTLPYVLKACGSIEQIEQVHTHVLKIGYASEVHSANALIHSYIEVGHMESARRVFDCMVEKDVVSANLMINGLMKCGRVDEALSIWESMEERNVVSWTTMIKGCVELGLSDEALRLFRKMIETGVRPDKVALAAAVEACCVSGSLAQGEWIHSYVITNKINVDSTLTCVLIDMYAKCGALDKAKEVFNESENEKNVATWTALINGLGAHGQALEAIELFHQMQESGIKPNSITFTSILTACSHAGLVNEGNVIFRSIEVIYKLKPSIQHYGCMVDLMARAGRLEQAMDFIENMPIKPNAAIWGAVIKACCARKNMELGKKIAKKVIELEPDQAGRYVQMASLYAMVGDWDRASTVRNEMKDNNSVRGSNRLRKVPGRSVINLNEESFEFLAIPYKSTVFDHLGYGLSTQKFIRLKLIRFDSIRFNLKIQKSDRKEQH